MAHQTKPNGIEHMKPIWWAPREDRHISSKERILINHGLCKRLLCLLIATEKGFHCRGRKAVHAEAFPPPPCLDVSGECPEIPAEQRLRIERLLHGKHCRLIGLQKVS